MGGILCCFLWWVVESRSGRVEGIRDNLSAKVAVVGVVDVGWVFAGVEVEVGVSVGMVVGVGVGVAIGMCVEARIHVCVYIWSGLVLSRDFLHRMVVFLFAVLA